ncbi:hypothetical protein JQC67_05805 [Aurantibacter crassamenti]|nr:hypothetical protein [Aurantibacter crassamenti]MBM1105652.1 hypothetical protein [Aurantibacter crassamenti]
MTSCGWLTSKEERTQELVQQELLEIDFNEVDNYPLFENCDETLSKSGQRQCFEQEVLLNCAKILEQYKFVLNKKTNKNVLVDFLVDQNGKVSVLKIEKDSQIDDLMPEFNQLITQGLEELPSLQPALKRGIPVKAKFRIPIVLNNTE